ncbi:NADH-quinone oxidoreductase subunit C [Hydrogenimonas sp.]|uniref:NADH-quinone oxidoreductase subunit C n=1 Tax=Hydrogenimonas sp. TaxID=2231112 RepID=UPI002604D13B|nr:NADH-quinone oxidoreductase subunit C [Hydrogenimonas sp.]
MKKIETTLERVVKTIEEFYDRYEWHFLTLNGIDLDDGKIELQWIFAKYGAKDETVVFYCITDYETEVPSIVKLIPSAIMGEREVVDMFGLTIEGIEGKLYLSDDSLKTPLKTMGLGGCEV